MRSLLRAGRRERRGGGRREMREEGEERRRVEEGRGRWGRRRPLGPACAEDGLPAL